MKGRLRCFRWAQTPAVYMPTLRSAPEKSSRSVVGKISYSHRPAFEDRRSGLRPKLNTKWRPALLYRTSRPKIVRSEERRVGKECRCRWATVHNRKKGERYGTM